MIIDLKAIRQKGLVEKEFSFEYPAPETLISLPQAKFRKPVTIDCLVEVYKNEAYVSGSVYYSIDGECSRCLSPASIDRTVSFDEKFVPTELAKADDENVYERDRIDLTSLVQQLILTDMPFAIYCKEACLGLCPTCGKNLNDGECNCEKI